MCKREFLAALRAGLRGLPQEDIEERLTFYAEMIDDRTEDGLSEDEAVAAIGAVDEIVAQTVADTSLVKIAKERIKPKRRLSVGEIVLLALGSPIWLSLCLVALTVIFTLYVAVWSVIAALWAVFAAFAACFVAGIATGAVFAVRGHVASGIATIAAGAVCAGLAIFMFYGCRAATKGILMLTKKIAMWIKNCFMKKENAQ